MKNLSGQEMQAQLQVGPLEFEEIASLVCEYFCQGHTPAEIARLLERRHNRKISREVPYKLLTYAASRNRLRFVPPPDGVLETEFSQRYPFLRRDRNTRAPFLSVVQSPSHQSVADRAAELVLELIQEKAQEKAGPGREAVVRVGFVGGFTMAEVATKLAVLLRGEIKGLPPRLAWHSLMAGMDPEYPHGNPVCFLAALVTNDKLNPNTDRPPNTEFVDFPAPPLASFDLADRLRNEPVIRKSFELHKLLDIIVTSAGRFDDEHSMVKRFYAQVSPEAEECLSRRGCVGDMLWLPMTEEGPLDFRKLTASERRQLVCRPMTAVGLEELPGLIGKGTRVVLAVGHCPLCLRHKAPILRTILAQKQPYVTHVVVDSFTAREVVRGPAALPSGPAQPLLSA